MAVGQGSHGPSIIAEQRIRQGRSPRLAIRAPNLFGYNGATMFRPATSLLPATALAALLASCGAAPADERPNLIVMMADDLGWGDIGANGGTTIQTPHIDALAAEGVLLTDGYVSATVCSPSRAGLYTGRYQQRHGFEFNVAGRDTEIGLALAETTLADMLKAAGYATGLIGKWHQGKARAYHPLSRGFDEYYGMLAGGSLYIDSRAEGVESWPPGNGPTRRTEANAIFEGFEQVEVDEYITDAFRAKAVDFIERHRDERFFLMLTPNAPHTPLQATQEYLDRYRHLERASERIYAAMVAALDDYVGAVTAKLRETGLEDNTLFVFLSDNGCAGYVADACSNGPLRGFKRYHWEGGTRIPFIAKWPARLPQGAKYGQPVISLDLFATLAAAAGSDASTPDSIDLLPYLSGAAAGAPHERLFWRAKPNMAIRQGKWKLWKVNRSDLTMAALTDTRARRLPMQAYGQESPHGQLTLLYDLSADIGERTNLAAERPEIVAELEAALQAWDAELAEPLWPAFRSTLEEIDGEMAHLFF